VPFEQDLHDLCGSVTEWQFLLLSADPYRRLEKEGKDAKYLARKLCDKPESRIEIEKYTGKKIATESAFVDLLSLLFPKRRVAEKPIYSL
jgi:hypothetical protein